MSLKVLLITLAVWISLSSAEPFNVETKQDLSDGYNGDDFMDVMVKREEAKDFLQRDRRDLNHECYAECCRWEEVREHYEFDIPAAERYYNAYLEWKKTHSCGGSW